MEADMRDEHWYREMAKEVCSLVNSWSMVQDSTRDLHTAKRILDCIISFKDSEPNPNQLELFPNDPI